MKKCPYYCHVFILFIYFMLPHAAGAQQAPPPKGIEIFLSQPDNKLLKFKLSISNPAGEKLIISVIDRINGVINTQVIASAHHYFMYDLSQLPDGSYSIEVKSSSKRIIKDININTVVEETRVVLISKQKKPDASLGF